MHTAQLTTPVQAQRYWPYIHPETRACVLSRTARPNEPPRTEQLRVLKRMVAYFSEMGWPGRGYLSKVLPFVLRTLTRDGDALDARQPQDVAYARHCLSGLAAAGALRLTAFRVEVVRFAVGNPQTGLLGPEDVVRRAAAQKKARNRAQNARRRKDAIWRPAIWVSDMQVPENAAFLRNDAAYLSGGLPVLAPAVHASRAASPPRKNPPRPLPNPARVIIRGGIRQPNRRPSTPRDVVLGQVEQMNLLSRHKAKGYTVLGRTWAITNRHRAHVAYAASLASQPETTWHNLPEAPSPQGPPSPPAQPAAQPQSDGAGAVACPSLARRPRPDGSDLSPGGVQAPNYPGLDLPADPAARLERLKNLTPEEMAIMDRGSVYLTDEEHTLQQAQQDAQEQGFGESRPVTPRVGSMATEPIARGLHLTPAFGRQLHKAHPWTATVPMGVLARAGGTQATVTAAVLNMQRRPDLGPGALVACVRKMAQGTWGLPVHLLESLGAQMRSLPRTG